MNVCAGLPARIAWCFSPFFYCIMQVITKELGLAYQNPFKFWAPWCTKSDVKELESLTQ